MKHFINIWHEINICLGGDIIFYNKFKYEVKIAHESIGILSQLGAFLLCET